MLVEGDDEEDLADAMEEDDGTADAEPNEGDKGAKKKVSQKKVKVGESADESPAKKKKGLCVFVCVCLFVYTRVCILIRM